MILTPQARTFVEAPILEQMTEHPVRSELKHPTEPDILPRAHAIVVLPVTFHTLNTWALGITDTLAVGLLCEYTGLNVPIVALPATGEGREGHRAFARSVRMLRKDGIQIFEKQEILMSENGLFFQDILTRLDEKRKQQTR